MPKNSNQKQKLLYLMKILNEETDEIHPMPMEKIISRLADNGVSAERKSLYSDIETLIDFGVDVVKVSGGRSGYFVGSRVFELPELKLLADAVQSANFITERKSAQLIKKLEGMGSLYDARQMQRQIYISGRVKTQNESIFQNVDKLHTAISLGKKVSFLYFEWAVDFKNQDKFVKKYRKSGARYLISPFALCWDDDNYYLVGYDRESDLIKNYRVDKMEMIEVSDEARDESEKFGFFNTADYSKRIFGMFGGRSETVKLRFENRLVGVALDRFGKDAFITRCDDESFNLTASVIVSPQFFSWLFGLGNGVSLISPEPVKDEYKRLLECILAEHK